MQLYRAEVRLGGSMTNTVIKDSLSAAEVIVLRKIHGADSVIGIRQNGSENREYDGEYQRLCSIYGRKKVEECFPGSQPELPNKLKEAGVFKEGIQETVAHGPNNKDFKTKKQKELADLGIDGEDEDDEEADAA